MIVETNPPKSTKPIDGLNAAQSTDEMRIAWRYNNLEKVDSVQGSTNQVDGQNAYTFDLSQCVDGVDIPNFDLTTFDGSHDVQSTADATSIFHHSPFHALLDRLKLKIREETFDVASTTSQNKNLLRIGIESLGSPLWWSDHFVQDLCQFLTILKAAVRHSHAVCCITMPTYLFKYTVSLKGCPSQKFGLEKGNQFLGRGERFFEGSKAAYSITSLSLNQSIVSSITAGIFRLKT